MSMIKVIPLRDYVVIESAPKNDTTEGGIFIPDTADKERPEQGSVVAVGSGKISNSGERVEPEVKKGDKVLFSKYGPTEIKIGEKEYLVVKEEDIMAILED